MLKSIRAANYNLSMWTGLMDKGYLDSRQGGGGDGKINPFVTVAKRPTLSINKQSFFHSFTFISAGDGSLATPGKN